MDNHFWEWIPKHYQYCLRNLSALTNIQCTLCTDRSHPACVHCVRIYAYSMCHTMPHDEYKPQLCTTPESTAQSPHNSLNRDRWCLEEIQEWFGKQNKCCRPQSIGIDRPQGSRTSNQPGRRLSNARQNLKCWIKWYRGQIFCVPNPLFYLPHLTPLAIHSSFFLPIFPALLGLSCICVTRCTVMVAPSHLIGEADTSWCHQALKPSEYSIIGCKLC